MKVISQKVTDRYAVYHADVMDVIRGMPDNSMHYSISSPPFASLYTYSASPRDMGNVASHAEFFASFRYLVPELLRVIKPGRLCTMHCMNLPTSKARDGFIGLSDFRGEIIRAFVECGWIFHSEVVIWTDPVTAMQRTKALGLLHKTIKKDSSMSRMGIPDTLVTFRKPGENAEHISHSGESDDMPVQLWQRYASPVWATRRGLDPEGFEICVGDSVPGDDASTVDRGDTLQHRSAREEADERHICPLQLEVYRRCIKLWTNEGDTVFEPFGGIGSGGTVSLGMKRRYAAAELKRSYYEQMVRNLDACVEVPKQVSMFDAAGAA